jgi:signal peptidase I
MRPKGVFREYFESLLAALLIALLLRTFVIAAYKIPTGSMIPTLKIGDCIFAYKLPYGVRLPFTKKSLIEPKLPNRGDVIVFRYPEDETISFIKRVVGLPGDKIEIKKKKLFINDQMVRSEPVVGDEIKDIPNKDLYLVQREMIEGNSHLVMFRRGDDNDDFGPEMVPSGEIFVLGDNRDSSDDSRFWGSVPLDNLEGRAFLIWASFNWDSKLTGPHSPVTLPSIRTERFFTTIQ